MRKERLMIPITAVRKHISNDFYLRVIASCYEQDISILTLTEGEDRSISTSLHIVF